MKPPRSLGVRIALTALVLVALFAAATQLLLPGVGDDATIRRMQETSPIPITLNVGVFALGIAPFLYGYILVELAALTVPRWRRLRHGNPEGRVKLDRAARAVGLVLATMQAFSVATHLSALFGSDLMTPMAGAPTISVPLVTATLVGGACVAMLVADFVTKQGIVNGLLAVLTTDYLLREIGALHEAHAKASFAGTWETRHTLVVAGAALVAVGAVWIAVRDAHDVRAANEGGKDRTAYRDARALVVHPWIPVPSSSFVAFTLAASLIGLTATLAGMTGLHRIADALAEHHTFAVTFAVLLAVMIVVLTRALHRPAEAEDLARRLGASIEPASVAKELRRALLPTFVFFAAIIVADEALARVPSLRMSVASLPLLAALAIDAMHAIRSRDDLVGIWQERRSASIPVVRAVLASRGIETRVNGAATNAMLQSFAPYAPATILVPSADAERAAKLLRHLLLGEEAPEGGADDRVTAPPASAMPTPLQTRIGALAGMLLVACGLVGAASMKPPPPAVRTPAKLEVVAVADDFDAFGGISEADLVEGTEIRVESAPLGVDEAGQRQTKTIHFASVNLGKGERVDDAIRRGEAWTKQIEFPRGMRAAWEPTSEWDEETGKAIPSGARTFVLEGDPVLTNEDIVEAEPAVSSTTGTPEVYIAITLTPEGGKRFAAFTRERVNRRLAILLDGRVNSAPVVRTAIEGGKISITMGAYDFEKQLKDARALAAGLSQR